MKIVLILALVSTGILFAQNADKEAMKEKIEAHKIAFITEKVSLTPEEAASFWPIYNQMQEEMKSFRKKEDKRPDTENMSGEELEQMVQERFKVAQAQLDLKKDYHSKFTNVLSIEKVVTLYHAEKEFRKEMIGRLKEKQGK